MKMLIGVIIGFIICGAVYGAYYYGTKSPEETQTTIQTVSADPSPTPNQLTDDSMPEYYSGAIEGSISYPSEGIPTELEICAYHIDTKEVFCTKDRLTDTRFDYGVGYRLELKPGSYQVYATLQGGDDYKAYYSEAVLCGLSVDCTNHDPIIVAMTPLDFITDIDPADWYDTSQN